MSPGPDRPGGVGGLGDGGDAGLQLLLLVDVRDEGEQQLGAVGEVQVQRLPGDAHRTGQRRHGRGGALLFGHLPGRVENPHSRA